MSKVLRRLVYPFLSLINTNLQHTSFFSVRGIKGNSTTCSSQMDLWKSEHFFFCTDWYKNHSGKKGGGQLEHEQQKSTDYTYFYMSSPLVWTLRAKKFTSSLFLQLWTLNNRTPVSELMPSFLVYFSAHYPTESLQPPLWDKQGR